MARATARPVCDALEEALARHGVPEAILSDGKVFTARFGPGPVLFDKICHNNGIKRILNQAPFAHPHRQGGALARDLRAEFLNGKVFGSMEEAQAALDAWVHEYNHTRPHQGICNVPPFERFRLASPSPGPGETERPDPTAASRQSPPAR